jgi:hypothetical protein
MVQKKTYFDPEEGFFQLRIVQITGGAITLAAIIISVLIIINDEMTFLVNSEGFNNLLHIFKVPIGILALLIPFAALYAAAHRSEQTKRQIQLTSDQNRFANYFRHREEFSQYIEKHANGNFVNDSVLHKQLFGGLDNWYGPILPENYDIIDNTYNDTLKLSKKLSDSESIDDTKFELWRWQASVDGFGNIFSMKNYASHTLKYKGQSISVSNHFYYSPFFTLQTYFQSLEVLLKFDNEYVRPESLEKILSVDLSYLPQTQWVCNELPPKFDLEHHMSIEKFELDLKSALDLT